MATKKQKREAALVKRAAFEARVKEQGLRALERGRHNLEVKRQKEFEANLWKIDEDNELKKKLEGVQIKPGQTSFYSHLLGRPVNEATFNQERALLARM